MNRLFLITLPYLMLTVSVVGLSFIFDKDLVSKRRQVSLILNKAKSLSSFKEKNKDRKVSRGPASFNALKGLSVVVPHGETAYLDESTNIDTLTIYGTLLCDEANADPFVELRVKTIYVHGTFQCGTSTNPYNKKLVISLKDSNVDPQTDSSYRGLIVMMGGSLILNGERSKAGWVKLGQSASPGQNYIIIENKSKIERTKSTSRYAPLSYQAQNKFKAGDTIAIGPTGYDYSKAETFTITGIDINNPYKLYLDGTLSHHHYGQKQYFSSRIKGNVLLDERAEVANLSRSIVIRADEKDNLIDESDSPGAEIGGHVMVHHNGYAAIDSVEFYKMGQAGIMARYPFHWHYVGDASGQFVKNSSIHHSFQRCITIHKTQNVLLQNNVCFNFKGHGYFLEDGNETGNRIIKNLAMKAKAPYHSKLLLSSDDKNHDPDSQGRFPSVSGFWISNPDNYVTHNVVSGSIGTGFWMSFEVNVKDSNGNIIARPLKTDTDVFSYNKAHACKTGMTWDGAAHGGLSNHLPNNPNDRKITSAHYDPPNIPIFRGLVAYKNYMTGIYFRGQSAIFKDNIVADNGWSYWHAYNQIIRDTVFIGKTANYNSTMESYFFSKTHRSRYRRTGFILYDGPFEIHRSDFLNFSIGPESKTIGGTVHNTTSVPFTSTGGSNKFTNIVSDLYFYPEPFHRAHMLSENEYYKDRQHLGNALIRDLDGSLIGRGSPGVVVGKRSLGILPSTSCVSGGEKFKNFKVCNSSHTEGSLAFMRWGSSSASPWSTPFIVRRSDNKYSYPKNEWNLLSVTPNNLFATVNSTGYSYELLPKFPYTTDSSIGATAKLDANTESTSPISPIVKIIAYGNNCSLGLDAIEVNSRSDLLNATHTSYYSNNDEFYVRIIPKDTWKMITVDPLTTSRDLRTIGRYPITCDPTPVEKRVVGKIERIIRNTNTTTIKGYACNYTHNSAIQVKVYAYGPPILAQEEPTNSRVAYMNTYSYLTQATSNQTSEEAIAFKCGKITTSGRRFNITINNSELSRYTNHKFAIKGISNSGGQDIFLENSNRYYVLPKKMTEEFIRY